MADEGVVEETEDEVSQQGERDTQNTHRKTHSREARGGDEGEDRTCDED